MKEKAKPYLLLTPILLILVTIFVAGIVMAFIQSLGYFEAVGLKEFTLRYYVEILKDKGFLESLSFSLYTSLVSSVMATIFGVILSYSIFRLKENRLVESLLRIPIIVPHLISVLLVYNILSQSGIIPRLLFECGLIDDQTKFPSLLYNKNGFGIIITYLWKEIPFVALTTYTILNRISTKLSDVARNLGANSVQTFFYVILPIIMPSILSSFIIIFAFSFGAYEVPLLLGPTYPKALSVRAFIEYSNPNLQNRPYAMVINILITVIALVLTWLYFKAFERINKYEE